MSTRVRGQISLTSPVGIHVQQLLYHCRVSRPHRLLLVDSFYSKQRNDLILNLSFYNTNAGKWAFQISGFYWINILGLGFVYTLSLSLYLSVSQTQYTLLVLENSVKGTEHYCIHEHEAVISNLVRMLPDEPCWFCPPACCGTPTETLVLWMTGACCPAALSVGRTLVTTLGPTCLSLLGVPLWLLGTGKTRGLLAIIGG